MVRFFILIFNLLFVPSYILLLIKYCSNQTKEESPPKKRKTAGSGKEQWTSSKRSTDKQFEQEDELFEEAEDESVTLGANDTTLSDELTEEDELSEEEESSEEESPPPSNKNVQPARFHILNTQKDSQLSKEKQGS